MLYIIYINMWVVINTNDCMYDCMYVYMYVHIHMVCSLYDKVVMIK